MKGALSAALLFAMSVAAAGCTSAAFAAEGGGKPFFMFTTAQFSGGEPDAIRSTLGKYVTGHDYLGLRLGIEFPELGKRVGRSHLYVLPTSVKAVARHGVQCGDGTAGLVIYDGENWPDTPAAEQADMPQAIQRAKSAAKTAGCAEFGISPGGEIAGVVPAACRYDLAKAVHRNVDWSGIALFNIQAQTLLSDTCSRSAGVSAYVNFVSAVARDVRSRNSTTKISAQLSFRHTPPGRMIEAIGRLRGVVDGFYLAYPQNVGPSCAYCKPQNLATVLAAIRST